jgi:hypothetical protein
MNPARAILLSLILTACSVCQAVHAADIQSLAVASVPVPDRSEAVRSRAIVQGLDTVLVRLTGMRNPVADAIRGRAQRYLLQYSFATREVPTEEDREITQPQLFLDLRFDLQALSEDIISTGLPLWGDERPETLLWLIVEDETGGREIVVDGTESLLGDALDQAVEDRGISVVLPLFDIEDQIIVTASDLWAQFEQPVLQASERYQPDVILTARVARIASEIWETRWLRLGPTGSVAWITEATTPEGTISAGIDALADEFARNFSIRAEDMTSGLRVRVRGVTDISDYARVLSHLEGLTVVLDVMLLEASGEDLLLQVTVRGGRDALHRALALDSMLMLTEGSVDPSTGPVRPPGTEAPGATLVFDLRP